MDERRGGRLCPYFVAANFLTVIPSAQIHRKVNTIVSTFCITTSFVVAEYHFTSSESVYKFLLALTWPMEIFEMSVTMPVVSTGEPGERLNVERVNRFSLKNLMLPLRPSLRRCVIID